MRKKTIMPLFMASSLLILAGGPAEGSQTEQRIEQPVRQSIDTRQATQKEEEQWRLEKEKLVARYEQLQEQEKQLTDQKQALTQQIASAKTRIVAKKKQLADIEQISRQIQPFILEIFNALKSQVADGYPFWGTSLRADDMREVQIQAQETKRALMQRAAEEKAAADKKVHLGVINHDSKLFLQIQHPCHDSRLARKHRRFCSPAKPAAGRAGRAC
jgi:hypothetical protein